MIFLGSPCRGAARWRYAGAADATAGARPITPVRSQSPRHRPECPRPSFRTKNGPPLDPEARQSRARWGRRGAERLSGRPGGLVPVTGAPWPLTSVGHRRRRRSSGQGSAGPGAVRPVQRCWSSLMLTASAARFARSSWWRRLRHAASLTFRGTRKKPAAAAACWDQM